MMNLVSRLIGVHQLMLFNFYPFVQRFLQPHQREVTKVLLFLAQASHDLVPPEIIETAVKTVANNFVTERNSSEVMAVGLNAIRETCSRCPLSMSKDLLDDLVMYKSHKDKGVLMAARSIISLYRDKNPSLLHRNLRGKPTESMKESVPLEYGKLDSKDYIPGAEVLPDTEKLQAAQKDQEEWSSCSEEEEEADSDGSWVDVSHSSDEQEEEDDNVKEMNPAERAERASNIVQSRILSQEEFKAIRKRQIAKSAEADKKQRGKAKKRAAAEEEPEEEGEILKLSNIEGVYKKRRHDRDSRLASVMAGREGREKFAHGETRMNPNASTTNREKRKTKNFQMVKHKIKATKSKRSFQDKKVALTNALLRKLKSKK